MSKRHAPGFTLFIVLTFIDNVFVVQLSKQAPRCDANNFYEVVHALPMITTMHMMAWMVKKFMMSVVKKVSTIGYEFT
jgi:hypothetical protein